MQELFGPLSMRALEDDQYVRQTEGYLPEASVAFIDEIFKANSAILNTLLTILNERLFDNGNKRIRVPLICLVRSTTPGRADNRAAIRSPNIDSGGVLFIQKQPPPLDITQTNAHNLTKQHAIWRSRCDSGLGQN